MKISDLKDKKTAIWGLGREGLSTIQEIEKRLPGMRLFLLDENQVTLPGALTSKHSIKTGEIRSALLKQFDVVIISPGISIYKEAIQTAKKSGVYFTSHTNLWFAEEPKLTTIAVSGTKGKSTTSSLINFFLNKLGKNSFLAGNIGKPLFEVDLKNLDYLIIELSSYQIATLEAHPDIALLVNLYPEHADWHSGTEQYYQDKLRLLSLGKKIIFNGNDEKLKTTLKNGSFQEFNTPDTIHNISADIFDYQNKLFSVKEIKLTGGHNFINLCAALTVIKALGLNPALCEKYIPFFDPLPHRLCTLGTWNGITYIDDSISTIPETAIAALHSLNSDNITILLGGYDRQRDWRPLLEQMLKGKVSNIIAMGKSGERLFQDFNNFCSGYDSAKPNIYKAQKLPEAVKIAKQVTKSPGIILLSPASPSYSEFKSFEERGKMFECLAKD